MIDEIDQGLLTYLQNNGFRSINEIADYFKIGPRTVQRRIKKIRKEGIFRIVNIPNWISLGYKAWAKIGIKTDSRFTTSVAGKLAAHPSVYSVVYTLNGYDILISVAFLNLDALTDFVNHQIMAIEGVISRETMLLVRPKKYFRYRWNDEYFKNSKTTTTGITINNSSENEYQASDLDQKILEYIIRSEMVRPAKIRQYLGTAEYLIRRRLNYLKDNNYVALEVIPNKEVVQNDAWATIGVNVRHNFDYHYLAGIISNPSVYLVSECLGKFDLIIGTGFNSIDILTHFVNTQLVDVEGISGVQTLLHSKPVKYYGMRLEPSKAR
jgi:DNA-binding Lrp family transcriptional regulator